MAEQKKLIIIDDDPDYVAGIKSVLETGNYNVDVAYNPKDGFKALQTKRYDLLLLDIMMGRGAEGVALARKIQEGSTVKRTAGFNNYRAERTNRFSLPWAARSSSFCRD